MKQQDAHSAEEMGLLAYGTSARWDISIDEFVDREMWLIEVEGPQTYLVFQLRDLSVVREAFNFLRAGPKLTSNLNGRKRSEKETSLLLGRFGNRSVSLIWDDEDFVRCFLVIGSGERSCFRMSFEADDVQMLIQALEQVVKELPPLDSVKPASASPSVSDPVTGQLQ